MKRVHNFKDLTGEKFARLTVIELAGLYREKQAIWLCKCECGKTTKVRACSLKAGNTRSCGCLKTGPMVVEGSTVQKTTRYRYDLTGERFGRLVVDSYDPSSQSWKCRCDCGNEVLVPSGNLRSTAKQSCGCIKEGWATSKRDRRAAEYRIWYHMRLRCLDKEHPDFHRYGGRGITVCQQWVESFELFFKDMGARPSKAYSLDRSDNNGPYSPENCRWATRSTQSRNTSRNRFLTLDGASKTVADWARELGVHPTILHQRLRLGWTEERVLGQPFRKLKRRRKLN